MMKLFLSTLFSLLITISFSQQSILLVNAKAHIGDGTTINNSLIGIKDGKITLVKNALITDYVASEWDTIIDVKNQHVYPGFIAPNSTLGLVEIEAVRATRDADEVGTFSPHIRSIIAYNTDSRVTPTVKSNGVLLAQITPRGGYISGTSSIVQFDGVNWEDAAIKYDDGVHLNWPKNISAGGWWAEPGKAKNNKDFNPQIEKIYTFFQEAKAYAEIPKEEQSEINLRFEAMRGLFSANKTLFIHCDEILQMNGVIRLCDEFNIERKVIVGGRESYLIADRLKENNFSVMIGRTHSLPTHLDSDIDEAYNLPAKLYELKVPFCFQNAGSMEAMNTRNLPFNAGSAVGYGLPEEEAVKSLTLSAAQILNIDADYGSLTEGKVATLFVSKGNALEMLSNDVTIAIISGKIVSLNNAHKVLYEKYKKIHEQ